MNPQPSATSADFRLQAVDANAVDVLLDPDAKAASASLADRTKHAGQLLGLLDAMQVPTPSADVVELTMRRIQEAPAATESVGVTAPAATATGNVGATMLNTPDEPEGV